MYLTRSAIYDSMTLHRLLHLRDKRTLSTRCRIKTNLDGPIKRLHDFRRLSDSQSRFSRTLLTKIEHLICAHRLQPECFIRGIRSYFNVCQHTCNMMWDFGPSVVHLLYKAPIFRPSKYVHIVKLFTGKMTIIM